DLTNHDADGSNIADLFAPFLEGTQGNPPIPEQVLDSHNNNDDVVGGVKGLSGPVATGHREVVWDGVPEVLDNRTDFSAQFFNRSETGTKGVRGGIVFDASGGTGEEVNDFLHGQPFTPPAPVAGADADSGASESEDPSPGGDFSNINPKFANNLLSI